MRLVNFSYIAISSATNKCYDICEADPRFSNKIISSLRQWLKDDAFIELVPTAEARRRFDNDRGEGWRQLSIFNTQQREVHDGQDISN